MSDAPSCKVCRHYWGEVYVSSGRWTSYCKVSRGDVEDIPYTTRYTRSVRGPCGPTGKLYEPAAKEES